MSQQTDSAAPSDSSYRLRILQGLDHTRARTLELIESISDDSLEAQHSRLMSPIAWDLGHIAAFEELWLVDRLGHATRESELESTYDAFRTPRAERHGLDLMDRSTVRERLADVRRRTARRLADVELDSTDPLLASGFAWELVRQHEAQHQETVLQTIQLMQTAPYLPVRPAVEPAGASSAVAAPGTMVVVPAGPFEMGASPQGFAYDNERPAHTVDLPAYEIGVHPVTNGEFILFMAAGGYLNRQLWSEEGWTWVNEAGPFAPHYWLPAAEADTSAPPDPATPGVVPGRGAGTLSARDAAAISSGESLDGWRSRTALGVRELRPDEPVIHVSFHEAEAFARFAGARLPSEAEWEKAAAWDPDTGRSRPRPWGTEEATERHANIGQRAFGVFPVGSHPAGVSAAGCHGMHGDAWEWTSTQFAGYPGFAAFPYPEYSEVFFGPEYRVLRGSSWATAACVVRNTFRNWDYPIRRQIFSGFRLARDVG